MELEITQAGSSDQTPAKGGGALNAQHSPDPGILLRPSLFRSWGCSSPQLTLVIEN